MSELGGAGGWGVWTEFANLCAVALVKCLREPVEDLLVDTYFGLTRVLVGRKISMSFRSLLTLHMRLLLSMSQQDGYC